MHNVARPAAAWQAPQMGYSGEAYDAIPRSVQGRDDLTYGAKCLYGALRTAQNTRKRPTYAELAKHVHGSVRSVVRWVQQLAKAGLIAVKRRGQGLPNLITVLWNVTSGHATAPQTGLPKCQPRPPSPYKEEETKKPGRFTGYKGTTYRDVRCRRCSGRQAHCDACSACLPGPHTLAACYRR